jgi:hypothetical protein
VLQVVKIMGKIIGFAALTILLAFRIAVAAVLAVITPIVMPILALLSGGGLLVATGFACAGHWHDAAKGLWASLLCGAALITVAVISEAVNPFSFAEPVVLANRK